MKKSIPTKRRLFARFLLLALALCLLCGSLVSCQWAEPTAPILSNARQDSDSSHLTRYILGEGTRSLTLEDCWEFTLKDSPIIDDDTAQNTDLICRDLKTGESQTLTSLYYNPYSVKEDDIQLYPFDGILGCSGVILSSHVQGDIPQFQLFQTNEVKPQPLIKCEGTLYTAQVSGFDLLLTSCPFGVDETRNEVSLFWRDEDGICYTRPQRDSVRHFLGLDLESAISLSVDVQENADSLSVRWQAEGAPVQKMELNLADLLIYAQTQAVREVEVLVDYLNGDELLKLVLEERRLESWNVFEVERVLVYCEDRLLQTLLPRDWEDLSFFGSLYDYESNVSNYSSLGQPIVEDLNFDGIRDFGLICTETPAQNLPYLYFLWSQNEKRFNPLTTLCAPVELDTETQQVIENVNGGHGMSILKRYKFDANGDFVLLQSETK